MYRTLLSKTTVNIIVHSIVNLIKKKHISDDIKFAEIYCVAIDTTQDITTRLW